MEKIVFTNRTLNLKKINYIGFDMDHTLIRYNSENFERIAHHHMIQKLIKEKGYPEFLSQLKFEYNRAIRGLVIDKNKGNILKLSRFGGIRVSFHGINPIDFETQKKIYKSTYIDLNDSNYETVDTAFSVSYASLFAQLVEEKNSPRGLKLLPEYPTIADDLTFVLDQSHRDGSLKNEVENNLDHFIIKDKDTVRGMERFIKHGKKIFLLTNSDFNYTKMLLDYAINPFLKDHDSWSDLFEYVITSAQKPRFFFDKLRFLKIDPSSGAMHNVGHLLKPGVYQGGCASVFTADLNLDPDEILYVGDHIYGDILRLKKDCAWRTALVVEELEDEIQSCQKSHPHSLAIDKLMEQKIPLEYELNKLISKNIESGEKKDEKKINALMEKISGIDGKISPLIKKRQNLFNPYWGEVMRAGIEESYFAYQVERFACIYMAKLSDMLNLSPRTYFRASKRNMPHED